MNGKTYEIATAIDEMCHGFIRALREKRSQVVIPLPFFSHHDGAIDE